VPKALEGAFFVAELTAIRALQADPYFLFGVMLLPETRNIIRSKVKGGHLYVSQLKTLPIPLPPLDEQREIARILQTVDRKIEAEEARRQALETLFKSLLHHLMTAKIRLPADFVARFEEKTS
jgi:type I restriction enzyme S subunit